MNFRKALEGQNAGFQMAPMIDIMFLLLVFFMVASIEAQLETKLPITVPTAETGEDTPRMPSELIINIDQEGRIFLNNSIQTPEQLQQVLQRLSSMLQGSPVIIRADAKTDYEDVIEVLDICRRVDIWNVRFATIPPEAAEEPPAPR